MIRTKDVYAVLSVLANHHRDERDGWMFVLDIMKESGCSSGEVYPVLYVLERDGRVEHRVEPNRWPVGSKRHEYRISPDRVNEILTDILNRKRKQRARKGMFARLRPGKARA